MKTKSAVIRLVLRTNKKLANGYHPIMLRVSFGYRKEKSTGYCCDSVHWDKKNQLVTAGFQNAAMINAFITELKHNIVARKLRFEMEGRIYTPEMLLDDFRPEYSARSGVFRDIMEKLLAEKPIENNTKAYYRYSYRMLADFMNNPSFLINDLTENKMRLFIKSMLKNVTEGTVYTVCAKIAAVSNYAIEQGILREDDYCFKRFKYAHVVKRANKTAYIDLANLIRMKKYYLNLVTEGNNENWTFKEGALERLRKRTSKEFALCFWLAMLKLNGSAPIDVALLKIDHLKIRNFCDGKGVSRKYYCFDYKRAKTGIPVRPRIVCDRLALAIFQPFIETASLRDGYIFPIVQNDKQSLLRERSYDSIKLAVQYVAKVSLKWMSEICKEINEEVERINNKTGQNMPLIDLERLSCYNMRHSFAMAYLSSPGANINSLASLLARSPNNIGTYITQLSQDQDLIASVAQMGI